MRRATAPDLFAAAGREVLRATVWAVLAATTPVLPAPARAQVAEAHARRVAWVPNPRRADGTWVSDHAGRLRPATVATLNAELAQLERETGAEIAVVVVDSLSGLEPFEFALAVHRGWGVGKAGRDNGVVFLWAPVERSVFISVGYGLEGVLPDRRVGRIRDEEVLAAFRRDAFDEGVLAGERALAAAVREETAAREGITPRVRSGGGPPAVVWLVGAVTTATGAVLLFLGLRRWRRNRPRRCPKCRTKMERLDERADDKYLAKGERLEERLESVDYDVWRCGQCGETIKIGYASRAEGVVECPECHHCTMEVRESTIRKATERNQGMARLVAVCANCRHRTEKDKVLPVISSSSSSSDGGWSDSGAGGNGGGDFGGGSAGGGGAGGNY